MKYHVLTLFPEMIEQGLNTSILGKASEKGLISFEAVNIRDFTNEKHGKVDDYTYGGGAGMLMQAQPVYDCVKHVIAEIEADDVLAATNDEDLSQEHISIKDRLVQNGKKTRVIYVTPQGSVFNQKMCADFAKSDDLVFLCGHYEGIDERVLEEVVTDYVSIGDYVLTGGELPAMVMIDAISRLIDGVLNNHDSAMTESFENGLLEYPQYSRPSNWLGKEVPPILLSGDHKKVDEWRFEQSILRTKERRPDLYDLWKEEHS